MKNDKFFITPDMMPRLDVDIENIDFERFKSKEHQKEFKKSKAYKYVKRSLDREKARKKQQHKDWWKLNSWNIINTLIAIAALIISILK